MRIVIQRVREAAVEVQGKRISSIGKGLLLLVGFSKLDEEEGTPEGWDKIVSKIPRLRIFPDEKGRFNLGLKEYGGEILVVSQFTLYADTRRGRRPSFTDAASSERALNLYKNFLSSLKKEFPHVKEGIFGADMNVYLCNWGPVTIIMDTQEIINPHEKR